MKKIRLGILAAANIAYRRFLPALMKHKDFEYAGVASREFEKTKKFTDAFGGRGYASYDELLADKSVDAVYIPLPPALHYEWGKKALESGKHVFMEKPFCISARQAKKLVSSAESRNLALHENYMFMYHKQLKKIKEIIDSGKLGKIRLYKIAFGFPHRGEKDFRYNKELGGGALLDCGGYTLKLANYLLGNKTEIICADLVSENYPVDLYGTATLQNDKKTAAQIAFGMDCAYKCELEVWGSEAILKASRIFTAPPDLNVELELMQNNEIRKIEIGTDDQFLNSIEYFKKCIADKKTRETNYEAILYQAKLVCREGE